MILRILFYAFVIYLVYKLVVDFIIPVYRTTRQVKKGFREMKERMQQFEQQQQAPGQAFNKVNSQPASSGDYIDFEEVKD